MARKKNDDLLMSDDFVSTFFDEEDTDTQLMDEGHPSDQEVAEINQEEELPGQLAVDVYETENSLVIKARTAGVSKDNIDVSISEGILTITGTLSGNDGYDASQWHIQECYWGEFSRTLSLPVEVKEEEASATLKDGILTISLPKVEEETHKIKIL